MAVVIRTPPSFEILINLNLSILVQMLTQLTEGLCGKISALFLDLVLSFPLEELIVKVIILVNSFKQFC